jgi:hypothetical protein
MGQESESPNTMPPSGGSQPSLTSAWPWWLVAIVIIGSLLIAIGAVMALFPSGEHLNTAGRNYAEYFATRNLAMAAMLLVMLALRVRNVLAALMILTAFIQLLDMITAAATARIGLTPIDIVFAAVFLIGASRLLGQPFWRGAAWQRHS